MQVTPCKSISSTYISSHSKLPNLSTSFLLQNYCLLNRIIFADKWSFFRSNSWVNYHSSIANNYKETQLLRRCSCVAMCASHSPLTTSSFGSYEKSKKVWIWTKSKEVMTAAVERGWNTFIFSSQHRQLANEWTSIALISPLYIEEGGIFDGENRRVATIFEVSNPQELQQLQPANGQAENVVLNLLDWQVIPAENIVAAFQGCQKTVFAISKNHSEAQVFFEALEQGLGGVILKVEDTEAVFQLKDYFDRRNEVSNLISLTEAIVTRVQVAGMGDRVCVDLCSLMRPGEGLLVGSFARGLFLVHSECLESNYIASRPFRVNAGDSDHQTLYSILLQNAETVALVCPCKGAGLQKIANPVTSLKVGDEVTLRVQGGACHTGIEVQEFIVEN